MVGWSGGTRLEIRAMLIARTEVARTSSTFVQQRARAIGATQYIWRTARDSDVRPGHKKMEGVVCDFSNPPEIDEGSPGKPRLMRHGPGEVWNCRCHHEVLIPDL